MIRSFKSRALERYWLKAETKGIRPDWQKRVRLILSALDAAKKPEALDLPGLKLHRLSDDMKNRYAVTVSKNWRVTFAFDGEDAVDVALEDYHGK